WGVVFNETPIIDPSTPDGGLPDGGSPTNRGRVEAYGGPIYMADAALYLKAHQPTLGITDPYELSQAEFDAAKTLLQGQHPLIKSGGYWRDYNLEIQDFTDGSAVVATAWPYQVNTLQAAGAHVASVVPSEGATGWADTT